MESPQFAVMGAPGGHVQVLGAHFTHMPVPFVPAGGVAGDAGILAFTGVGPGTLPLAIAGLVSIIAGVAATIWGRDKKGRIKRRAPKHGLVLPDLSHLAGG